MKTSTKIIATTLATFSLGAAGLVFAQQGMGPGPGAPCGSGMAAGAGQGMGPGMGMGPGTRGGMHGPDTPAVAAARLGDLKAELKIAPAQEPAWQAYEAVLRKQAEARQAFHAEMQARMQDPAAAANIDRAAQHEAMTQRREARFAEREAARQALFAVLTPEQQTLAGQRLDPGQRRHMGKMGHRVPAALRTPAQ